MNKTVLLHQYCAVGDGVGDISSLGLPVTRTLLYTSFQRFNRSDNESAADYLMQYRDQSPGAPSPRTISFQYALFAGLGRLSEALTAFRESYFSNQNSYALYPIEELVTWSIAEAAADAAAMDRAMLLHVHSRFISLEHSGDLSDAFVRDRKSVDVVAVSASDKGLAATAVAAMKGISAFAGTRGRRGAGPDYVLNRACAVRAPRGAPGPRRPGWQSVSASDRQ
jgi:hypothetical protein